MLFCFPLNIPSLSFLIVAEFPWVTRTVFPWVTQLTVNYLIIHKMKIIKTIPALPVHNIDKAAQFYETKFGFNCLYKDKGFAKLMRDEAEIHLWAACDKSWKWRSIILFVRPIWSGS